MKGLCRLTQVYKQSYRYPKGKDTVASAVAEEGNYRHCQIRWLICRKDTKLALLSVTKNYEPYLKFSALCIRSIY